MTTKTSLDPANPNKTPPRRTFFLSTLMVVAALVALGVTALLVTIFERRSEARSPFVRLAEVDEVSTDPRLWGVNWPHQFDSYQRTVDVTQTRFGGSSAMPESKLEEIPWLRRLYAGYAFSIDYRERRGHAYMLYDQEVTERVTKKPQGGACLHCHASVVPTYRRLGLEAEGLPADAAALAADFNWPAVERGFELAAKMTYFEAHAELLATPDGGDGAGGPLFPGGRATPVAAGTAPAETASPETAPTGTVPAEAGHGAMGRAHPVSCIDCHDPQSMAIRVTRPGFVRGIAALAASDDPVAHLPSVERWRSGDRTQPYNPNTDATRQEMRSFVCGQCHVEYYCASKETLFFPWSQGLKVENIEAVYDNHTFPNGEPFHDFVHGETGAKVYKAQHPEFELWSQGVHARSGVACADCHMPYQREGAMKVSSHWVRSPLLAVNEACQTCHNVPEAELLDKVATIQDRTKELLELSGAAMVAMLDAIREAQAAGFTAEQLAPAYDLQKKAMWRLDFISSENSMGFHAPQEAARILAESIDFSRRAEAVALRLMVTTGPVGEAPVVAQVEGISAGR